MLGQDNIKVGKKMAIFLKNKGMDIYIHNNRNIYINENLDVVIIEIKQSDWISSDSVWEIDQNLFKDNSENIFESCPIYLLHYPKGTNPNKLDGVIAHFNNYLEIYHTWCSYGGTSGGDQNGYCILCPKRCSYKEHKNRDYYLIDTIEEKTVVLEELKRRYFDNKEKLEKNIYKLTQSKISSLDIFNKAKNIYNEINYKNDWSL